MTLTTKAKLPVNNVESSLRDCQCHPDEDINKVRTLYLLLHLSYGIQMDVWLDSIVVRTKSLRGTDQKPLPYQARLSSASHYSGVFKADNGENW